MIEAHLKGLARRRRTKNTCIQCLWVCVLVSCDYKPAEARTQSPRHLPLPYNRKEVTLLFVALIRNKSLSTWVRKATEENPAKKPAISFGHLKPLFIYALNTYALNTYDDILCAESSASLAVSKRSWELLREMSSAGYHSHSNLAPHPVTIMGYPGNWMHEVEDLMNFASHGHHMPMAFFFFFPLRNELRVPQGKHQHHLASRMPGTECLGRLTVDSQRAEYIICIL